MKFNGFKKLFILFFSCCFILSIIEAFGGYLIEWIFGKTFWDYSNLKFNIGKYVALEMALIWGTTSTAFIYILKPFIDKKITKIPNFFTYFLCILIVFDLIATIILKH